MRPLLNWSPKSPKEQILSSHTFKSNSKCCNFCILFPNSIKLVGKFFLSLLVSVIKFSDQSKLYWFFGSRSKFRSSIWVHQTAFDGCNFGGFYLLHSKFVFNKICWVMFPLKSSYCGKIFMSIQVVLNVREQFKVLNSDIFRSQWTSAAYNFFIQGSFSIFFVGKVASTSLVCMAKFSYQSKN